MSAAAAVVLLFLFLSSTTSAAAVQANSDIITVSSYLTPTANPAWFSSSQTFAFGFYPTPNGFAICIFFDIFFDKTVVWTANTQNPIIPDNVVLLLTKDGLVLQDSSSRIDPIYRIGNSSQPIAGASMLDNGNFVLYNSRGSVIWQSYDHPTNSLVAGQRLSPGAELLSQASETDFKNGNFRLEMQTDGNLVLYNADSLYVTEDAYYASGTYGRGNNVSLNLESNGHLYLFDGTSIVLNITMGVYLAKGTFYLVRIDVDGILRLYSRSKDENAVCNCLPGYNSVSLGNWNAGCTTVL